jgi:TniQ
MTDYGPRTGRPLLPRWTYQLESLPFTSPPLPGELPNSYLSRLTSDNHCDLQAIADHLGDADSTVRAYCCRPRSWDTGELILNDLAIKRLARLTGYPASTLHRALGMLGTHRRRTPREDIPTLHWSAIYDKPVRTATARVVPACPRCAAKRGITAPIRVIREIDRPACPQHGIWLIDNPVITPFNTAEHPDLVKALRHHHNLRRRHPADQVTSAFRTARTIWFRYRPGILPEHFDAIQQRWISRAAAISAHADRNSLAVLYPEIVTLTSVLVSSYWTAAAARPYARKLPRPERPDLHDFLQEVARRVDHPDPAKFAKASSTIGIWARENFPGHITKLKFGHYPVRKTATKTGQPN